jgi:hypothetical protein
MDRNELPLDPRLLGLPSGVPKINSTPVVHSRKPCTYLVLRLTQSPNGPKRASTWPTSPRSTIGCIQNNFQAYRTFGANRAPILRRDYHYLQIDRNKLPLDIHYIGVPSGVPKAISMPVVQSAQTMHFSCVKIKTISKQIKMSFRLIHVT